MRYNEHLPVCYGDFFRERVMGESRIADDDRSHGYEGSAGLAVHSNLFHVQHAARNRERRRQRQLPATAESTGLAGRAESALHGIGQMGDCRNSASTESVSEVVGWNTREARSAINRVSSDSRRELFRSEDNAILAELRA